MRTMPYKIDTIARVVVAGLVLVTGLAEHILEHPAVQLMVADLGARFGRLAPMVGEPSQASDQPTLRRATNKPYSPP
jgi:hypothetical protein